MSNPNLYEHSAQEVKKGSGPQSSIDQLVVKSHLGTFFT